MGKTEICLKLAKIFQTEIISSDSRQFYRETEIGTAKPTLSELAEVKHHFVNSLSIFDMYDVRKFEIETLELLEKLFAKHDLVILTGGSGLYIDAICFGFDEIPNDLQSCHVERFVAGCDGGGGRGIGLGVFGF